MEIAKALTIIPKGDELMIISDSMYALQGLIDNLRKWEDQGWMKVQNMDVFQKIAYELDIRGGETYLQWIKGHSGDLGNDGADAKASEGVQKEVAVKIWTSSLSIHSSQFLFLLIPFIFIPLSSHSSLLLFI